MDGSAAASVGGFFALRTTAPPDGTHRPLARLYAGEQAPLTARIDTVAARLDTSERRVAASVAHLGLASRLWSVALGPAALTGSFPGLSPAALHWDPRHPAPDELWLDGTESLPGTACRIREAVQYGHLVPLAEAIHRDGPCPTGCCGATRGPRWRERCANSSPGHERTTAPTWPRGPAHWPPNSSTTPTSGTPAPLTTRRSAGAAAVCTTAHRPAACAVTASSRASDTLPSQRMPGAFGPVLSCT